MTPVRWFEALSAAGACAAFITLLAVSRPAPAEPIGVADYGTLPAGMPYAVALEKGFFKEAGVDVNGIADAKDGSGLLDQLRRGKIAYAELAPGAVLASGGTSDLRIISGNVNTFAEYAWIAMPGARVKTLPELRDRRLGFEKARSLSEALAYVLLEEAGLHIEEVYLVPTGDADATRKALEKGDVDLAPIAEPAWSVRGDKYKLIASAAELFPPLANTVGVTTAETARTRGDFLRGVLKARSKAVEYLYSNPKESAAIVAKVYKLEPELAEKIVNRLVASDAKNRTPYWGRGEVRADSIEGILRAQRITGAVKGNNDWSKMIDESFLPEDLRSRKP